MKEYIHNLISEKQDPKWKSPVNDNVSNIFLNHPERHAQISSMQTNNSNGISEWITVSITYVYQKLYADMSLIYI